MGFAIAFEGLNGVLDVTSQGPFFAATMSVGLGSSLCWPTFVTIMANWFPKHNRGFLIGLWATCPNVGNILGI